MSNFQLLPKGSVSSNSQFFYKDITTHEVKNRIPYTHEFEKKLEIRHNKPNEMSGSIAFKNNNYDMYSAFDKAINETYKINNYLVEKEETFCKKRENIRNIVIERNKMIKDKFNEEKRELAEVLTR